MWFLGGEKVKLGITGDTHGDLTFKRFFQARKLGYTHIIVCVISDIYGMGVGRNKNN